MRGAGGLGLFGVGSGVIAWMVRACGASGAGLLVRCAGVGFEKRFKKDQKDLTRSLLNAMISFKF